MRLLYWSSHRTTKVLQISSQRAKHCNDHTVGRVPRRRRRRRQPRFRLLQLLIWIHLLVRFLLLLKLMCNKRHRVFSKFVLNTKVVKLLAIVHKKSVNKTIITGTFRVSRNPVSTIFTTLGHLVLLDTINNNTTATTTTSLTFLNHTSMAFPI